MESSHMVKFSQFERDKLGVFGFLCQMRMLSGIAPHPNIITSYYHAVYAGTIHIDTEYNKQFPAAIVWAEICAETAERYIDCGALPRFGHEYKEGGIILVLDVVSPFNSLAKMVRLLRSLPANKPVIYQRKGRICLSLNSKDNAIYRSVKARDDQIVTLKRDLFDLARTMDSRCG